ncbi:hypothetical protein [Coprococcus comes]|uniref:hypothetical protein n=1 Tax=Coprococcus comes TaxID=410072 RepID=UPI00189B6ECF|nr:hypothetical protein [Coprococcus comes]
MNKNFLEHYMKTKPETTEQKYLFLVDNQDMAFAIISAGYAVVTLMNGQDAYGIRYHGNHAYYIG